MTIGALRAAAANPHLRALRAQSSVVETGAVVDREGVLPLQDMPAMSRPMMPRR